MIKLKTKNEIELMREGGRILAWVVSEVIKKIKPGASTEKLNDLAEKLIKAKGARSSFKNYKTAWSRTPFPSALCISINDEVVHGLPVPDRKIKDGDIVGIDCGLEYRGLYTDMARSVAVGKVAKGVGKLLSITEEALMKGIKQVKPGNHISDISKAIQAHAESAGFTVVRQLVGHGVGYAAHEDPQIPNYLDKTMPDPELRPGMTLAIEPMINVGSWEVETLEDDWTIVTADSSLSAHFEHTVAVTDRGCEIITKL